LPTVWFLFILSGPLSDPHRGRSGSRCSSLFSKTIGWMFPSSRSRTKRPASLASFRRHTAALTWRTADWY